MMIKKKIIFIICAILFLTACTSKEERDYKMIRCTRKAQATSDNVKIDLSYQIYYKDDYVKKVVATDKVISSDSSIIEEYAASYKKIYSSYDGLKHFKNQIKTTNNSMTSVTEIDYAHIDTDKLLEIEGKEDNVVDKDGKVPLKDFISFYEKYGAECDD